MCCLEPFCVKLLFRRPLLFSCSGHNLCLHRLLFRRRKWLSGLCTGCLRRLHGLASFLHVLSPLCCAQEGCKPPKVVGSRIFTSLEHSGTLTGFFDALSVLSRTGSLVLLVSLKQVAARSDFGLLKRKIRTQKR